jgi:asparagine synthetase B (glutamine-hydrolysing)
MLGLVGEGPNCPITQINKTITGFLHANSLQVPRKKETTKSNRLFHHRTPDDKGIYLSLGAGRSEEN